MNNAKVVDEKWTPTGGDLVPGGWLVVRSGNRYLAGVRVTAHRRTSRDRRSLTCTDTVKGPPN